MIDWFRCAGAPSLIKILTAAGAQSRTSLTTQWLDGGGQNNLFSHHGGQIYLVALIVIYFIFFVSFGNTRIRFRYSLLALCPVQHAGRLWPRFDLTDEIRVHRHG